MTTPDDPLRRAWQQRQAQNAQIAAHVFGYPEERAMLADAMADYEASGDMERDQMAEAEAALAAAMETDEEGTTTDAPDDNDAA